MQTVATTHTYFIMTDDDADWDTVQAVDPRHAVELALPQIFGSCKAAAIFLTERVGLPGPRRFQAYTYRDGVKSFYSTMLQVTQK